MKSQKGFIPIVLAIVIGAIALALVGVSVYYKVATDNQAADQTNTNQETQTSSCSSVCTQRGYTKGICQREGSSLESLNRQEANKSKNIDTITGENVSVSGCSFSSVGAWDACYCLSSDTDTLTNSNINVTANTNTANQNANTNTVVINSNTNANTNAVTNTNTISSPYSSAGCPTWPTYTDVEYGWTARYPCDWTAVRTYEATGEDMFDYPTRYVIFKDSTNHYRLFVGIIREGDTGSTINRTGVGAGDFVNQTATQVAGVSVPVRNLVFQNKVKEVFFYTNGAIDLGNYRLTSTFEEDQSLADYYDIQLSGTAELTTGRTILQSIDLP